MKDTYRTINSKAYGEFKDRGSKFFAYAFPLETDTEWESHLQEVKKEHPKARHHCYAYRFGRDKNNFRANDDGEPSGTAGRPILGQIDSFELTNVFIVVVRYFGGTKLGASGLINAYKTSAAAALETAEIEERIVEDVFHIIFDYALMSNVMNALKKYEVNIIEQDFGEIGQLKIAIRQSDIETLMPRVRAAVADAHLEEEDKWKNIEGFEMKFDYTR